MVTTGPSSALSASGATCKPVSGKLPASLPTDTECWCIQIPNGDWHQWVRGALLALTYQSAWDDDPTTVTPDQAHTVFMEMYQTMTNCLPVPIGAILEWPSSADVPDKFLECDGQALDPNSYPELFGVLGYTWGNTAGSFHLPDKSNKVSAGASGSHALASEVGAETETLTDTTGPNHFHFINSVTFQPVQSGAGAFALALSPGATFATQTSGGGQPHNNMQPTQYTRFIIAAGR